MRILIWCFLALSATTATAQIDTGEVSVAWDPAGEVCNLDIGPGEQGTLYVVAYPRGAFAQGITGSELLVSGFPTDWTILDITPNHQANFTLGNPLGPGANIAFPECQEERVVVLYTIRFVATSLISERILRVVAHTTPINPDLACPRLFRCDGPADLWACVDGGTAAINFPNYCVTPVASTSWSNVRALYR